jgi:hypothetical protein
MTVDGKPLMRALAVNGLDTEGRAAETVTSERVQGVADDVCPRLDQ